MIQLARLGRWSVATLASTAALLAIARASVAPLPLHEPGMARLRLSWRARPERIEVCRVLSAEELERREEHMRERVECDGRFATYLLRVEADDRVIETDVLRGAGLRHDRPLYLLREYDLTPGRHRIRVSFMRRDARGGGSTVSALPVSGAADTGVFAGRAQREAMEHARRAAAAIPPRLVFDTTLNIAPERVALVTLDPVRRALRLLSELPSSGR